MKKKTTKKAAPPAVILPKYVRKSVREDAIIWNPGEPLPEKLQFMVDHKIESLIGEYQQQQNLRISMDYLPKNPANQLQAVRGMLRQLSSFPREDQDQIIASFIQTLKEDRQRATKIARERRDSCEKEVDIASESAYTLDRIVRGDFMLITKVQDYGGEAKVATENLVAKQLTKNRE